MVLGLVVEDAGDVLADEEAGHADVAAEELVAHRQHAHVAAPHLLQQWPQHPGPVLAGDDRRVPLCVLALDNGL